MNNNSKGSKSCAIELSHPSVRIRGTENDYTPKACSDSRCKHNTTLHMHCPFCVKTEIYFDERILKAHYSVKHVDKGIEFAGLKILRCCENCDIVGVIKGEKKFKGAHWHCYKCRNGFNRRDEAIKHYKTHFRQPYSTFQIHITQEVNSFSGYQDSKESDLESLQNTIRDYVVKETRTPRKPLGTPVILKGSEASLYSDNLEYEQELSRAALMMETHKTNFAEETAIMIIQEDPYHNDELPEVVNNSEENLLQQKNHLEKLVGKLQNQIINISRNKVNMETKLREEIKYLKNKVHNQAEEIKRVQLTLVEHSLNKESADTCSKFQVLMDSLQEQHTRLLLEHIQQVRAQAYSTTLQQLKDQMFNNNSKNSDSTNDIAELHSRSSYESEQPQYRNSGRDSSMQTVVSSEECVLNSNKDLEESPYEVSPLLPSSKDSDLLNSGNISISGSESQASTSYLTTGSLFAGASGGYSLTRENGEEMSAEQSFGLNTETNSMTAFIIGRDNATCNSVDTSVDGPCLSRSYFIVSQNCGKSQKRVFDEMQCEDDEQTLMNKECKCDP